MGDGVLDAYRPREEWFRHNPLGIHGIEHAARVLVWAEHLADAAARRELRLDREVLRCAAAVHDVGRIDDGVDPDHGKRSAAWVARNAHRLPVRLTAAQLEAVCYLCEWHVPADGACPEMTAELRCLKDADGLDRVRINDLNAKYLRTAEARALEHAAWELLRRSGGASGAPWERVRAAAQELGLWR